MPPASRPPTGPESLFTEVVALSALLFDVPTAVLALGEDDAIQCHASYGPMGATVEPQVATLCLYTAQQQQALLLPDLALAPAGKGAAAARALAAGVRFYAGVPLSLPGAACLGTLCVLDQQPRHFTASDKQLLGQLAQVAERFWAIRQHCLTSWSEAAAYWRIVQEELRQETRTLLALVRLRCATQGDLPGPVPLALREVVDQQLSALNWRLADYYPGLL